MAVTVNGRSITGGSRRNVRSLLNQPGGQQRVARELANQRRARGAAGAAEAARNWGIRVVTAADRKAGTARRGQKFMSVGRNG